MALDRDVKVHDLVDAIVVHTNWEAQVEKLVEIIRKARVRADGLKTGSETGSETGFSERRMRDGFSRARDGQGTGSRRVPENSTNEEKSPVEPRDGPETGSGGTKT